MGLPDFSCVEALEPGFSITSVSPPLTQTLSLQCRTEMERSLGLYHVEMQCYQVTMSKELIGAGVSDCKLAIVHVKVN